MLSDVAHHFDSVLNLEMGASGCEILHRLIECFFDTVFFETGEKNNATPWRIVEYFSAG